MRRGSVALGLGGLVVACSAASTVLDTPSVSDPPESTSPGARAPAPASTTVLATFEGSFDSATGKLSLTFRDPTSGAVIPELTEGTAAGDVYLHTEGTNGDGRSDPPTFDGGVDQLMAVVDLENGTGSTITGAAVNITAITPATTVGMVLSASIACSGTALGGGAKTGPCTISYPDAPAMSPFPKPFSFASARTWTFSDLGGGPFSFKGTVTGTVSAGSDAGVDAGHDAGADASDAGQDAADAAVPFISLVGQGLNFSFGANFAIGDQKPFLLLTDTGSTDLGVASTGCCRELDAGAPFTGVSPLWHHDATYVADGTPVSVRYGQGGFDGFVSGDTVGLVGGSKNPEMKFCEIQAADQFFGGQDTSGNFFFQGIAGFGPSDLLESDDDSFMATQFAAGVPSIFAFQFCDTTGKLWLGTLDPSAMGAAPQYSPLNALTGDNFWYTVDLQGIGIAGKPVSPTSPPSIANALVDTGTSLVLLPTAYVNQIYVMLDADTGFKATFGSTSNFTDQGGGWLCADTLTAVSEATVNATVPQLSMTLPKVGGGTFTLSNVATNSYLLHDPTDFPTTPYCIDLQASDSFTIIGDVFTSEYITIFDIGNNNVGFAPQVGCNTNVRKRYVGAPKGQLPQPRLPHGGRVLPPALRP